RVRFVGVVHQGDFWHGFARQAGFLEVGFQFLNGDFGVAVHAELRVLFLSGGGSEVRTAEEARRQFATAEDVDQRLAVDRSRQRATHVDVIGRRLNRIRAVVVRAVTRAD